MRKGIVRVSPSMMLGVGLPNYWEILSIHMNRGDRSAVAIIAGPEFPEVPDGEDPAECRILVTKHERYTFKVKEV